MCNSNSPRTKEERSAAEAARNRGTIRSGGKYPVFRFPSLRPLCGLLGIVILACALPVLAQTNRGGISGTVYDTSGAVIPGARVEAVSKDTGLHLTQTATSAGVFTFPDLLAGTYTVTVTLHGFQQQTIRNVIVDVAKVTSLHVTLGVSSATQTVEVSATAAAIDTQDSSLNAVVNNQAVQTVPLNGRDYRQLLVLTPGFVSGGGSFESQNGNRSNQNNWQLDGIDNNDLWQNSEAFNQGSISGIAGVLLPIDSIDEFNQQSQGGGDYGRNPGSMVDVVTKSGTNAFHGSLYEYNRNQSLAAENPFTSPGSPNELINNNFGGSLGGPIVRNKAFFFISYEGQRFLAGNAIVATVPSNAWVTQAESVMSKYNVAVNPVMVKTLDNLWPVNQFGSAPATVNNFVSSSPDNYASDNFVGRIDYNINAKNRFFVRSIIGTGDATAYAGSVFGEYFQAVPSRQSNWAAEWTSTLSPRIVNQVAFGYNYFLQNFNDANAGSNPPSWGFNTGVTAENYGSPNMTLLGFPNGGVGETPNLGRTDKTWQIDDNLSYTVGSHQLKMGGEFRRANLFVHYLREARGAFTFDGLVGPWANNPAYSAQETSLADFLAGYVNTGLGTIATGNPARTWYTNSESGYFQDFWQVMPRLNVNYGIRYDYNGPFYDPTHQSSIFFPASPTGLAFPGQPGSPISSLWPADAKDFGPRLGFAFTPSRNGKTVIRGGFGIYYDLPNGNLIIDNRGALDAGRGVSRNPGGSSPVYDVTNTAPLSIVSGQYIFGSTTPQPPFGIYGINQNWRNSQVLEYNFNIQHQLSSTTMVQVGYVGNQARFLPITLNENQPPASVTPYTNFQAARPYGALFPQFAGITELDPAGSSGYNSLQAEIRSTSWHGLTGQLAYTYSHAADDMSAARNNWPANSLNFAGDWGNADFNSTHVLSAYALYEVPQIGRSLPRLGKGWQLAMFTSYDSGFPFSLLSGISTSNTLSFNERANMVGSPFNGITQPSQTGGLLTNGVRWLNASAFVVAPAGTFGNTLRNQFYGPSFKTVDFSVIKNTAITEKLSLQIRAEMFNIFNILNLAPPDGNVSDGSAFGLITTTQGTYNGAPGIGPGEPANVQLAIKFLW
jgi:Carboxypeptidase regulatory-like domain